MLQERVKMFQKAGLTAEFLSSSALALMEPSLDVGPQTGAAFLPDDCQLDAMRAVSFIEQVNLHPLAVNIFIRLYKLKQINFSVKSIYVSYFSIKNM